MPAHYLRWVDHLDEAQREPLQPLLDVLALERSQLATAPAPWLRWWRTSGESELRCILMVGWDPVGAVDAGWDEYDTYLDGIANVVRRPCAPERSAELLAEHLGQIGREWMGGVSDEQSHRNRRVAEAIVAWYAWTLDRGRISEPPSADPM